MNREWTDVAIAVVESSGRYLIGLRPQGKPLAGLWEFPGGRVEPGELPEDAAYRECREETGLGIRVERLLIETCHDYEHDRVRLFFFACRPLDAEPSPRAPFCWIPRDELKRLEFPAANRSILETLANQRP